MRITVNHTIPLPVKLLYFSAYPENNSLVKTQWSTASETNNDYFAIERSMNGITFEQIGTVKGADNSSTIHNYEFVDASPLSFGDGAGVRYYRLKQTDYDGKFEYYGPISVQCQPSDELNLVLQNIFSDKELKGTLLLPENSEVNLSIMDLQGRIVKQEKINAVKGDNHLQIDLKNISSGIYIAEFMGENKIKRMKLMLE